MQKQIGRLNETVENIIELTRMGFEGLNNPRSLIDLRDVVQQSVDDSETFAQQSGVTLKYDYPDRPFSMLGDPWNLSMMIRNLISNAIKYSSPGGIVALAMTAQRHSCELRVIDQGPGIAADQIKRIFDRFYRVDQSRVRDKGGSGLGLSIVREVARQHGGYESVNSKLGMGCEFVINLPLYHGGSSFRGSVSS